MNAFFARGVRAIRDWGQQIFQGASGAANSGQGSWFSFFSASRSVPAPMIQRLATVITVDTGTEAATGAKRVKPSIVRVMRVIRLQHRHWAGESRFQRDPLFVRPRTAVR
jgi:hypothetical protein